MGMRLKRMARVARAVQDEGFTEATFIEHVARGEVDIGTPRRIEFERWPEKDDEDSTAYRYSFDLCLYRCPRCSPTLYLERPSGGQAPPCPECWAESVEQGPRIPEAVRELKDYYLPYGLRVWVGASTLAQKHASAEVIRSAVAIRTKAEPCA